MSRELLLVIVIALGVLLLLLLPLGWRARARRQRDILAPVPAPADRGDALGEFTGKYVATTRSGDPLDRITVHGLGFRSDVTVEITTGGLLLGRPGESDIWIPQASLRGIRRATWTIDRVVEPDGLHLVEWTLGADVVDSYLRLAEPARFDAALEPLIPTERQAK